MLDSTGAGSITKKIIVVKSSNHFRAGFEPIASEIFYVGAPGALQPRFEDLPLTKLKSRIGQSRRSTRAIISCASQKY